MTAPAAFPRAAACQPGHTATGSQLPNLPLTSLPPGAPSHWPHGCRPPGASQPGPITAATPAASLPASAFSPVETVRRAQSTARSLVGRPLPLSGSSCNPNFFLRSPLQSQPSPPPLAPAPSASLRPLRPPCVPPAVIRYTKLHFPTRPRLRTRSSLASFASQFPPQCTRHPPPTAREHPPYPRFPSAGHARTPARAPSARHRTDHSPPQRALF